MNNYIQENYIQKKSQGNNILIIMIIIQVIILIGLFIRKKTKQNEIANPKIVHIIWFIISIGIVLSILLYLYIKTEELIYHTSPPASSQTNNQLLIKNDILKNANGT